MTLRELLPKINLTDVGGYYKEWCAQEYEYFRLTKAQLKTLFLAHELDPDTNFWIETNEMWTSKGLLTLGPDGNFFKKVTTVTVTDYPFEDVLC